MTALQGTASGGRSGEIDFFGNGDNANIMEPMPIVRQSGGPSDSNSKKDHEHLHSKPVKEILEPAAPVETSASVESACDHLKTQTSDSVPVTNPEGTLVGKVSADQMMRGVPGHGHDPKTTPVEPQMHKDGEPYCYEHESIAKAERVMRDVKADELSVVSEKKKLVGKATRGAIEKEKGTA
jgi:CBS domain-containing protein